MLFSSARRILTSIVTFIQLVFTECFASLSGAVKETNGLSEDLSSNLELSNYEFSREIYIVAASGGN